MNAGSILEFADTGGNVLLALAPGASDMMRNLALELGVEVDTKGTKVYDHFSRQAAAGATDPTLIATREWVASDAILGKQGRPDAPVLFRGLAQAVPAGAELVGLRRAVGRPWVWGSGVAHRWGLEHSGAQHKGGTRHRRTRMSARVCEQACEPCSSAHARGAPAPDPPLPPTRPPR